MKTSYVCFVVAVTRHRPVINLYEKVPDVHQDAFVAPSAAVIGDVQIGAKSSVWYGCVLRGKENNSWMIDWAAGDNTTLFSAR